MGANDSKLLISEISALSFYRTDFLGFCLFSLGYEFEKFSYCLNFLFGGEITAAGKFGSSSSSV